jgi:hypothetical protein
MMACQKPFLPSVTTTNANILVIEGLINPADSTIVNLSRTVAIANKTTKSPETKAVVTIENAKSTVYTLSETTKGTYVTPALVLDNTKQYRLRIKTSNGKTYLSDFVDVKLTPPIDSIGYTISSTGLQLYVNTHDATNNTRYYKWNYRETWQFRSEYVSYEVSNGKSLNNRTPSQLVQFCFASDTSTSTVINSTVALSNDVVYQFPISSIVSTSEKLGIKYSILLTQLALSKEAYTFWQNLKTNTEQLGSIFDAQPSTSFGNIHNINDSAEPVIGYISAGTIQRKRIYINKTELPSSFQVVYPYTCEAYTAGSDISFLLPLPNPYRVIAMGTDGLLFTTPACADCTIRGTTQQPSFWK